MASSTTFPAPLHYRRGDEEKPLTLLTNTKKIPIDHKGTLPKTHFFESMKKNIKEFVGSKNWSLNPLKYEKLQFLNKGKREEWIKKSPLNLVEKLAKRVGLIHSSPTHKVITQEEIKNKQWLTTKKVALLATGTLAVIGLGYLASQHFFDGNSFSNPENLFTSNPIKDSVLPVINLNDKKITEIHVFPNPSLNQNSGVLENFLGPVFNASRQTDNQVTPWISSVNNSINYITPSNYTTSSINPSFQPIDDSQDYPSSTYSETPSHSSSFPFSPTKAGIIAGGVTLAVAYLFKRFNLFQTDSRNSTHHKESQKYNKIIGWIKNEQDEESFYQIMENFENLSNIENFAQKLLEACDEKISPKTQFLILSIYFSLINSSQENATTFAKSFSNKDHCVGKLIKTIQGLSSEKKAEFLKQIDDLKTAEFLKQIDDLKTSDQDKTIHVYFNNLSKILLNIAPEAAFQVDLRNPRYAKIIDLIFKEDEENFDQILNKIGNLSDMEDFAQTLSEACDETIHQKAESYLLNIYFSLLNSSSENAFLFAKAFTNKDHLVGQWIKTIQKLSSEKKEEFLKQINDLKSPKKDEFLIEYFRNLSTSLLNIVPEEAFQLALDCAKKNIMTHHLSLTYLHFHNNNQKQKMFELGNASQNNTDLNSLFIQADLKYAIFEEKLNGTNFNQLLLETLPQLTNPRDTYFIEMAYAYFANEYPQQAKENILKKLKENDLEDPEKLTVKVGERSFSLETLFLKGAPSFFNSLISANNDLANPIATIMRPVKGRRQLTFYHKIFNDFKKHLTKENFSTQSDKFHHSLSRIPSKFEYDKIISEKDLFKFFARKFPQEARKYALQLLENNDPKNHERQLSLALSYLGKIDAFSQSIVMHVYTSIITNADLAKKLYEACYQKKNTACLFVKNLYELIDIKTNCREKFNDLKIPENSQEAKEKYFKALCKILITDLENDELKKMRFFWKGSDHELFPTKYLIQKLDYHLALQNFKGKLSRTNFNQILPESLQEIFKDRSLKLNEDNSQSLEKILNQSKISQKIARKFTLEAIKFFAEQFPDQELPEVLLSYVGKKDEISQQMILRACQIFSRHSQELLKKLGEACEKFADEASQGDFSYYKMPQLQG